MESFLITWLPMVFLFLLFGAFIFLAFKIFRFIVNQAPGTKLDEINKTLKQIEEHLRNKK